ncbi:MAG: hypothetical protein F6K11_36695 [Leptolyngbya sp. SIO3F4]|nr:hypothetical protein [Leptolyngbya sp. SIO3F4]
MSIQLTRKRIVNALLMVTLTMGLGSLTIQPATAQIDRSTFREVAEELNLSRSQMRSVAGIMRDLNSDIEDILTDEQFELLKSTREQEQTQNPQELQEALNLTDTQSAQLSVVREEMSLELQEVLTPEQLEGIMELTAFSQF